MSRTNNGRLAQYFSTLTPLRPTNAMRLWVEAMESGGGYLSCGGSGPTLRTGSEVSD
jgi:hypothetical protein